MKTGSGVSRLSPEAAHGKTSQSCLQQKTCTTATASFSVLAKTTTPDLLKLVYRYFAETPTALAVEWNKSQGLLVIAGTDASFILQLSGLKFTHAIILAPPVAQLQQLYRRQSKYTCVAYQTGRRSATLIRTRALDADPGSTHQQPPLHDGEILVAEQADQGRVPGT